jgi:2-(1,2-epoxy-1,2-dihydrophenyl)acetyl-CoA isomerase
MSAASFITFALVDGVATIRLTQSERGNPFDLALLTELDEAVTRCSDPEVRAVLIEAEGRFFSVGGDLALLAESREGLDAYIRAAPALLHPIVLRLTRLDAPVVVAVHGLAAGAAVSLIAAADLVVAGPDARFYAAYPGIGLSVDGGATHFLPRRVGMGRARSFYLRNQTWSAQEALDNGLADELGDGADARALAVELAAGPTRAYGAIKALLADAYDVPLEAQLDAEARLIHETACSDDAWGAITALASKRHPVFRGA